MASTTNRIGREHDGPVLIPERASDTAAAITLGYSAIGRPSAAGGAKFIASLLETFPHDRVSSSWPSTTKKLMGGIPGSPVHCVSAERSLPPCDGPSLRVCLGHHKDLRAFLNDFTGGDLTAPVLSRCRAQLEGFLVGNRQWVEPEHHYPLLPAPHVVSLEAWREQQLEARGQTVCSNPVSTSIGPPQVQGSPSPTTKPLLTPADWVRA